MDIIRLYIGKADRYFLIAIALFGLSLEVSKRYRWRIAFFWKDRLIREYE